MNKKADETITENTTETVEKKSTRSTTKKLEEYKPEKKVLLLVGQQVSRVLKVMEMLQFRQWEL